MCFAAGVDARSAGPPGEFFYGDKGLVFSAAFGIRGNLHRDDPRRTVDAARAIILAVEQLGIIELGWHRHRRRPFRVRGKLAPSTVRRARRGDELRCTADGCGASGILCDAPTERATRTAYSFEDRGAITAGRSWRHGRSLSSCSAATISVIRCVPYRPGKRDGCP